MSATPELLTLIITTSPTPSAPSTDLLFQVFRSFQAHCPQLLTCRIITVFDVYTSIAPTLRLKKGQVTHEVARNYDLYKQNVKQLIFKTYEQDPEQELASNGGEAEFGSPKDPDNVVTFSTYSTLNHQITFIEPTSRLGFGLALRTALRCAKTPYVWVHQHDWTLVADIPLPKLLSVMQSHDRDSTSPIKYIGLPSIRMLNYATHPDELRHPSLRSLTAQLKRDFPVPVVSPSDDLASIPLTPLFFWHDKPHIASTSHYLSRIFPSRLAIARGTFIEDTIGQKAREQMKAEPEMWRKWACWLYYPDNGRQLCLRHLQGRVWRGVEHEVKTREARKSDESKTKHIEESKG